MEKTLKQRNCGINKLPSKYFRWIFISGFLMFTQINLGESVIDSWNTTLLLIGPRNHIKVSDGPISFIWRKQIQGDLADFDLQRYEIVFWSKRRGFGKTFTVYPESDSDQVKFDIKECKDIFRRHGKYYWQVRGFDFQGNIILSETKDFVIELPKIRGHFISWTYPYEVQFQYTQRIKTEQFQTFLQGITSKNHLSSYSDLSLLFLQDGIFKPFIETQERVFLSSQIGLGLEFTLRLKLLDGYYFSLFPTGSSQIHWFSTGLKDYTSLLYSAKIGADWVFNPGKHLVLNASWIPSYRVHYNEIFNHLQTYKGDGWEWGIQITVPNSIIPVFRLFNTEIDFHRIPIDFHISRVQDEYTGTIMKMRNFRIGYRFQ